MTSEELEQRLQDYLDGRLTDEEREAFEGRIAGDPELARRVEDYRRLGRALREAPAELPPGFVARARARFEARQPGRRRWFRPLSWEMAGLAAAAALILAVFLPPALREPPFGEADRLIEGEAPGPLPKRAEKTEPADPSIAVSNAEDRLERLDRDEAAAEMPAEYADKLEALGYVAAETQKAAQEDAGDLAVQAGRKSVGSVLKEERPATEPAPGPGLADTRERAERGLDAAQPDAAGERAEESALAQPEEFRKMEQASAEAEDRYRRTAGLEQNVQPAAVPEPATEEQYAPPPESKRSAKLARSSVTLDRPLTHFAVASGFLARDTVRVIERQTEWTSFLAETPSSDLSQLLPDFAVQRVVLIGPRARPVDCSAITIVPGTRLSLLLRPSAPGEVGEGGCAVVIPAGGGPVEIVEGW